MISVKLFGTDLSVSPVCLGADNFGKKLDKAASFDFLDRFCDAGGSFIDTASVYVRDYEAGISRSEEILGQYLKERSASRLVIATKGGHYDLRTKEKGLNRACVAADLEESLRTLGVDAIDFYWLHRDDPDMPIEEIVDMMEGFVKSGKIRYYGASNYTVQRLREAKRYAEASGAQGFSAVSDYWTPLKENEGFGLLSDPTTVGLKNSDLDALAALSLPLAPYSVTAKGWLVKGVEVVGEKLNRIFDNPENRAFREETAEIAKCENCPLQTAFLRRASRYGEGLGLQIIPITSCSNSAQLEELLKF